MKKEEMRRTVNLELRILMPPNLDEVQQKLWRFLFNMLRQNDLAQLNPKGGEVIALECVEHLKRTNPQEFPS